MNLIHRGGSTWPIRDWKLEPNGSFVVFIRLTAFKSSAGKAGEVSCTSATADIRHGWCLKAHSDWRVDPDTLEAMRAAWEAENHQEPPRTREPRPRARKPRAVRTWDRRQVEMFPEKK